MRHLTCSINILDPAEGLNRVVADLKPGWIKEGFTYQRLHGGFVNTIFCCYLEDDKDLNDALTVKIFADVDAKRCIMTSVEELRVIYGIFEKAGCGPIMLASFENGLIYKYVRGNCLTKRMMRSEHIMRKATAMLAKLHSDEVSETSLQPGRISEMKHLMERLRDLLEFIPEETDWMKAEKYAREITRDPQVFKKSRLAEELQFLENTLNEVNMKKGFCHNDFYCKNLVYNSETDTLTLMDCDMACFNYLCYDFAHILFEQSYFVEFVGAKEEDDPGECSDDFKRFWIKYYLETKAALNGQKTDGFNNTEVELLLIECKIVNVLADFLMVLYSVANVNCPSLESAATFSIIQLAYDSYQAGKQKLPELVKKQEALKPHKKKN